jgi:GPH family glycoside/pentoside/hexuronide:cation symporter
MSMSGLLANAKDFSLGIVQTVRCAPFVKLCGATFLVFNGFQTVAQFSFFIIVFYLFKGDYAATGQWPAWFGTISALSTTFIVIPIVTLMSQKFGKRNTFIFSSLLSIAGYVLKWWCFNPSNPWLMFVPLPLLSFGIGGLFTLMMSMTADVCDLDEIETGSRREGTFGAVYWWMVKLGTAVALFTSGAVLKFAGFDQSKPEQAMETLTRLRLFDIVVPSVAAALAIAAVWKYDVSEERANEVRAELEKRRGKAELSN